MCPLCGANESHPGWLGATAFEGHTFQYVECRACGSLYCDPMPSADELARMYGTGYLTEFYSCDSPGEAPREGEGGDVDDDERALAYLRARPAGTFVDYGCGSGGLLARASKLGWRAVGVEFDDETARRVAGARGVEVIVTGDAHSRLAGTADVLHLGDVVEHLTDVERQMPHLLSLVRPGGLLLARGPLEANRNLFTYTLRAWKHLRPGRVSTTPPYHVLLATAEAQRGFFRRFGVEEAEFRVGESAWPAPASLSPEDLRSRRKVGLFVLRRVSQTASRCLGEGWGNRYFYAGLVPARQAAAL